VGRYGISLWGVSGSYGGWQMGGNQNGDVSGTEMVSGRYPLLWQSGICAGEDMKKEKQAFGE